MRALLKLLVTGLVLACASGCSGDDEDAACDASKRGCVQMMNSTLYPVTVAINPGGGGISVPSGTQASPGVAWTKVDSTVGAQITFSVSQVNPGLRTCVVRSDTWTDPANPPGVSIYQTGSGTAVSCVNWCDTYSVGCVP